MAALDFPNSPTVGQQYTAPNGAIYTWDGATWTVSGVISTGTAAGGDLAGTYPNPTVTPAAKSKWTTSGATVTPTDATKQVVIPGPPAAAADNAPIVIGSRTQKGRVGTLNGLDWMGMTLNRRYNGTAWARDDTAQPSWTIAVSNPADALSVAHEDAAGTATTPLQVRGSDGKTVCTLADASVLRAMIAVGHTVNNFQFVSMPTSFSIPATSVWTQIAITPAMVSRGGYILLLANPGLVSVFGGATTAYLQLRMDGGAVASMKIASSVSQAMPGINAFFASPAGSHTYSLWGWLAAGGLSTAADNNGALYAVEFS